METLNELQRVKDELLRGNVGRAISEMDVYLTAYPQQHTAERLAALKTDYELMEDYWRRGLHDPQQATLYQHLLQRMYVLYANVAVYQRIRRSSFLSGVYGRVREEHQSWSMAAIRERLESFVSEVAMLQLEPKHQREEKSAALYKAHQQMLNALFDFILTSRMWTDGVADDFREVLTSPTVDTIDQQQIVSAVMMSLLNQFDMAKFRLLTDVYRLSQDEDVRQRALVGWVLARDSQWTEVYPEQLQIVEALLASEDTCCELTELQMQLVYCLNAENDTQTIQKEIMPDLLKNNHFRITRNGIEEQEEDPMEDILNPDASEQRMERMEETFYRMMDMQRQGSDIYFGGFSQMKRYPFFYDMGNWFVPFYMQHPDIAQFVRKMEGNRFLERVMASGPFCSSDKYSFVIAFQQVMDRMPESMRQMMKRGEATVGEMEQEEQQSPAYIRRAYLMDVYRFFRLFPNRSELCNPFDTSQEELGHSLFFCDRMFSNTSLEMAKEKVVRLLKRFHRERSARQVLDSYAEACRNVQYYMWRGEYEEALKLQPHHERAMAGRARQLFDAGQYGQAIDFYDQLLALKPDQTSYLLNKAVCLVNLKEYEQALQILFHLNFDHPDDQNVSRVLAWALTCGGRLEQSLKLYARLTAEEAATAEDWLNSGYCLWLNGQVNEAAEAFRKYCALAPAVDADASWLQEEDLLTEAGISQTEIKMMKALVAA